MRTIKIDRNVLCKSILFIIICSVLIPSALAQDKIVVSTNRLTVLDDPSGWVYAGWGSQTARGNQMLGEQTTIKWYAFVIDQNGTAVPGVSVSTELKFPNGTVYYSTTGITDDNGSVEFSKNLDNLNQRPYFATVTEGYWRADVSATVNSQPLSSNTRFIYDEIGCGKSGSGCHRSQDWQPSTGASTKSLSNGGTFISPSRNSPYVQNRDKIHGTLEGHGHVDVSPPIAGGECMTCHRSYNGTYTAGSARKNNDPQYPGGVHQNQVNCTQCHGPFATEPDTMVLDMPVKKCYDCHPQLNDNLTVMNYIQDATNSYSYNPLSTSNTINGHNQNIPCITCHNNGHNVTKPVLDSTSNTITEYQQCLTCHTTYQNHNGGVDCTVCHSQDAHAIKIFSQNADYVIGKSNPSRGNCTNCHEDPTFINNLEGQPKAGSYTGDAPQIGTEFNHSTGEKWNRSGNLFWNNQLTACKYCHGDTKHDIDGLGKPEGFNGANNINTYGTWCGSCHYGGNDQYSNMLNIMDLIPPEITGDPTYGNYADGYFDHSGISGFQDSACKGCHGNRPNLTLLMHSVSSGTEGGPDCVSCHNVGSGGDQPHINVSAMNGSNSIHKDLNSGATTSLSTENKRCWACHGDGNEPIKHPDSYKTPYNCTDCHTGSNRNFTPNDTIKVVSEHYWNGDQIITSGVSSCYRCHNKSEMMIFANDPDSGSGAVYGGANGGNNSTSHYGKKRTDLVPGTGQYCSYCHNSTISPGSFFDVFADVYNTDIQNHSRYGTNPKCQDCHDSSSGSRIHDSNLTFAELTLSTSTICLGCHGPGGTASINNKSKHNNTVDCSVCHLDSGKGIHPIKYLNNTGGFGQDKLQGVKCDRCHESGLYNAPAIGKLQHSSNPWNGSLWDAGRPTEFWDNNSIYTACQYCHGDTKHNNSAVGRVKEFKGTNIVNVFGTWCGLCHYQTNSQYNIMVGKMTPLVAPEITKNSTYGNYVTAKDGTPYFNHSLTTYNDSDCKSCHYNGIPPNLTRLIHSVEIGGTSCLGCHSIVGNYYIDTTTFGKHANVSKTDGLGVVSDNDCKTCHFDVQTLDKMVFGYANFSNTYFCQDCHSPSGRNNAQYNNISVDLRKSNMPPGHAQSKCENCHIAGDNEIPSVRAQNKFHPNGPKGTALNKNCFSCHYRSDGTGVDTAPNVGLNDAPFNAPGEDHSCNLGGCHAGGSERPSLGDCGLCHSDSVDNHNVLFGGHTGPQSLSISGVTISPSPVTAGDTATVSALISNIYTQVTKAQYRINNSGGIVKDWAEMNASDGKFNDREEPVFGQINTAGLSGIYTVYVKGMVSSYTGGHDPSKLYYPDNGGWTSIVSVTMNVTGQTKVLASGQLYYGPGSWRSHFKVGNTGSTTNVNVSFYNSAGTVVNTTTTTIVRNTSADYQWQTYAPGVSDGTALINSTQPISAITFQRADTDGRLGFWEGIPLNTGSTEVFVSGLLFYPGGWRSGFKVLNTESSSTTVNIYFYNAAGTQINSITRTIAAKTSPYYDWYTYGYNITGGSTDGTVRVLSTDNKRVHVIASQAVDTAGKVGFWEGISLNSQNTDVFVSGLVYYPGGWRSGFKVANYGTSAATTTIYFYNPAGTQINSITRTIQPKTSPYYDWYTYGFNITGGATDGTARVIVSNSQPTKIIASQANDSQGMVDFYQASEISGNKTAFVLYQVYDSIERSGFKVANPGTSTISATIRWYNSAGTQINSTTQNIAAKASPYYAWNTYAPGVANGSATVDANGRIVVVASIASNQAARLGIFRGVDI